MTDSVPAITLTDPQNRDAAPASAQSPTRGTYGAPVSSRAASERPVTPGLRPNGSESSNVSWASPTRLIRSLSNNTSVNHKAPTREEMNNTAPEIEAPIDPLSQHIFKRTHTPLPLPVSHNRPTSPGGASQKNDRGSLSQSSSRAVQEPNALAQTTSTEHAHNELRKGVKAVSFLSRLMGSKKKDDEAAAEVETASDDGRPEGNDVVVFAESVDNMSYSPPHQRPPAYIKVRSKYKKTRDFGHVFLAQELECRKRRKVDRSPSSNKLRRKSSTTPDADTVWAMEFSKDGKYLAAAGTDMVVRVWAVLSSTEDRSKHERQEAGEVEINGTAGGRTEHLNAPVFQGRPVREYEGHTSTILDLSWSKNNFLLSSSMDKTVRLWHVTRPECLCTFKHNDFVPSISFHPKDDRFFLAGSLDSKLRLWSIPDKSVAYTATVPDLITAIGFTPDGKQCMAGCLSGLCMFYETEGLKYQSQIHVRSTRGQNAKGSKITGIQSHVSRSGDTKLLISSNDSRVRLYNFRDKSLELKFKGNENNCSQIRATISDDRRYVVCGSEDHKAYIWSLGPAEGEKRDKNPLEMFEAHNTVTTVVCFAPTNTKQLLSRSQDPIYDLCNPPPVILMSRAERANSESSSKPPTETGSVPNMQGATERSFERPKDTPAYLARQGHQEGNIIVTADFSGQIKVFRQDCAWSKRRSEEWDRSSLFAKRNGKSSGAGSLAAKPSQRSLREGRPSTSTQAPSDRILSWRQGIASTSNIADAASKPTSRSVSPSKSLQYRHKAESTMRAAVAGSLKSYNPSSADEKSNSACNGDRGDAPAHGAKVADSPTSSKPSQEHNPLMIQGGQSYMFWNADEWKARSKRMHHWQEVVEHGSAPSVPAMSKQGEPYDPGHLAVRPPLQEERSYVSELSDERSSAGEFDDAKERPDRETKCHGCGRLAFSSRIGRQGTQFVCTDCGMQA